MTGELMPIVVITTCEKRDALASIAEAAVAARLAACVQISGPIDSTYWWEGTVATAPEWRAEFKTTDARWAALRDFIAERHPYQVPEILMVPVRGVNEDYLDWLKRAVEPSQ